ncbi:MAG TPA: 2-dehydropantoate 2-reductase [Solirubrobacteraceae bacterium]
MVQSDVLVVGGGAIGGVTAALMTGKVRRVMVLDANRDHVERLRDPGLQFDCLGDQRTVALDAYADPDELPAEAEFALVTLKAAYLEPALTPLRERAQTFVSLGNGLVQDRVADLVGGDRLLIGTVEWGATNLGPGRLAQTTRAPFVIGEPDGSQSDRLHRLAAVLETAAEARISPNIRGQVWSKLLINSTWSGLGVVSGLLYGEIADHPVGRRVARAVWREGVEVGHAQGLELQKQIGVRPEDLAAEDEAVADAAIDTMMQRVAPTKASMLQDIERGVPCEVGVINGAVVQRGSEHGVPTPLNAEIVEIVRGYERGDASPSPDAFERLEDRLKSRPPRDP